MPNCFILDEESVHFSLLQYSKALQCNQMLVLWLHHSGVYSINGVLSKSKTLHIKYKHCTIDSYVNTCTRLGIKKYLIMVVPYVQIIHQIKNWNQDSNFLNCYKAENQHGYFSPWKMCKEYLPLICDQWADCWWALLPVDKSSS